MVVMVRVEAQTLVPGSAVDLDGLSECKWIEGAGPTRFEPGKVYIFECWATWCGPCLQSIPHLNELHEAYSRKGLVVSGMNVWESDESKVRATAKMQKMKYAVAFTGPKGSKFDQKWLTPAMVNGIPRAFVVIGGKLVAMVHPAQITSEAVEGWLKQAGAGKDKKEKEVDKKPSVSGLVSQYKEAKALGEVEVMERVVKELQGVSPQAVELVEMRMDILLVKQDWTGISEVIEVMADQPAVMNWLAKQTKEVVNDDKQKYPLEWVRILAHTYESSKKGSGMSALEHVGESVLYWRVGDRQKSHWHAERAVEVAKKDPEAVGGVEAVGYIERYEERIKRGDGIGYREFRQGMPTRP